MKFLKKNKVEILVVIIYIILFGYSAAYLMQYEDFYQPSDGEYFSFSSCSSLNQIISIFIYRYLLNFPLSIFNWFLTDFMWIVMYLFIPNAILTVKIIRYLVRCCGQTDK